MQPSRELLLVAARAMNLAKREAGEHDHIVRIDIAATEPDGPAVLVVAVQHPDVVRSVSDHAKDIQTAFGVMYQAPVGACK